MNTARRYARRAPRAAAWQGNVAASTRVVDLLWRALLLVSANKLSLLCYLMFLLAVTSPTTTSAMYGKAQTLTNGTAASGVVQKLGGLSAHVKEIFLILPLGFTVLGSTRLGLYVATERLAATLLFTVWALTSAKTRIWELLAESLAVWVALQCRGGPTGVLATVVACIVFLMNAEVQY